jgi:hypothetical protein
LRSRLTRLKFWEYPRLLAQERIRREAAEVLAGEERSRRVEAEELFRRTRTTLPRDRTHGGILLGAGLEQIGHMLSLLTLIGLLIYAVAMLGYRSFYDSFSINPEEVGLTYAPVLTQAAISVSFLASLFFIQALLGGFSVLSITVPHFLFLLWQLTVAIMITLFSGIEGRRANIGILAAVVVSILVLLLLGIWPSREPGPVELTWAALILAIALFTSPIFSGDLLADNVRSGRPPSASKIKLLNVEATEVEVNWMSGKPTWLKPVPDKYVYLGRSGETLVIYDRANRVVYRVPSQAVILSDSSDS